MIIPDCNGAHWSRMLRRRIPVYVTVAALATVTTTERTRADEPITASGIAIALLVGIGANAVWSVAQKITEGKPPKEHSKETTTVALHQSATPGHPAIDFTKTETHEVDPLLDPKHPMASISLPADWKPQPTIPGDLTSGTITGKLDTKNQTVTEDTSGLKVGFNAVDALTLLSQSLGGQGGPGVQGSETRTTDVTLDTNFTARRVRRIPY
jgi:hypothetical protein